MSEKPTGQRCASDDWAADKKKAMFGLRGASPPFYFFEGAFLKPPCGGNYSCNIKVSLLQSRKKINSEGVEWETLLEHEFPSAPSPKLESRSAHILTSPENRSSNSEPYSRGHVDRE
jgi:hypothetical protein